ncbi:MAG: PD-(D/E)XK nuclease family protein [bacterium]|nr:PD-(D/E)XK nuclease family protein [bacterium]
MTFTQYIANYIKEQDLDLAHVTLILPSERMRKFVSKALVEAARKPILAPEMITMDRWVRQLSKRTVIDSTRALLALFEIQLEQAKTEEDRSFEEFLNWGNILLSDFNEIDRYLLDAKQVFRNLADIKEIENWSFGEQELTASQKRFMEFWDRLPGYYYALNKKLDANEQCYMGSAYKALAEDIQPVFQEDKEHHFVFAGFNALSKAEMSIVRQLVRYGRGHYLLDADTFYYEKKTHEAGTFLREISSFLDEPKLPRVQDVLSLKPMDVNVIESVQKTGQVKVAATALAALSKEELNDTVLLLADESLIAPMVKNLPKSIGKANISLGLPIRNTAIKTWVDLVFGIQENKARFRTQALYFQDLQAFWNHPLVQAVCTEEEKAAQLQLEHEIIECNRIFLNVDTIELQGIAKELLQCITTDWNENWGSAMTLFREMNQRLYANLSDTMAFERAMLQCFDSALLEMENLVNEGLPSMQLKSFRLLFHQHWSRKSIAYHGNPTDGLQIMGMLETRGLDFKRIICLGMNEGMLPPTNSIQTLIPMDLRRYLELPTPREKQGIFAHHFYRLLHHCEELLVTYTSADESIGSNEPSRYLMQLEMELARVNPNMRLNKRIYSLKTSREELYREIEKTPELFARLDELFEGSTSASMLKKYLTCPLDFYFRYVMDFGEATTVEEEVEHSTFGTFIHNTLEILYEPFVSSQPTSRQARRSIDKNLDHGDGRDAQGMVAITSFDVEKMLKEYPLVLHKEFMKHFNNQESAFMKGKNLLSYQMAMELTERFLKSEIAFLSQQTEPVYIEALEKEYEATVSVNVRGKEKKVRLRGIIDRIDRIGERIRIVDYKTGRVQKTDVEMRKNDIDADQIVETMSNKKHVLQLLQYAFLYQKNEGKLADPTIISLVSGKSEPFYLDTKSISMQDAVDAFPTYLQTILEHVYDTDIPFQHTDTGFFSFCKYC